MLEDTDFLRKSPLWWRWFFGLKLVMDVILTGIFYFEYSIAFFWKLSFVIFSLAVFLVVHLFYANMKRRWLFHLLIIDFLVSASYGYVFIGGHFPNHLFIGITALAILMFLKSPRMLILSSILLLLTYLVTMGSIDWYLYRHFDETSYFISGSFIVFACIVSSLINFYQSARRDTLQLYAQLLQTHEKLREYALQTEEWAATRERVRIARDIHDTVGHKLTALLVQMQAARKLGGLDPSRSEQAYLVCEDLVRSALQEVRLSVRAIRDEPIKSTSLDDSLKRLSEEFTTFAKVQTTFKVSGTPVPLPSNLQLTAYRIVQESLTNAQKHGRANQAEILLTYSETGFSLTIINDGDVPSELKRGFGLITIQERVKEWNGEVEFTMDPKTGFAVEVTFPYTLTETERVSIENTDS
ncbi:sensor histidine kinase [Paenibacillus gansuensis]|uniref:histidine kinase n=1 Tax=Paenibacillus gansuensis TaxID=306542 RepID=A0ABW5PBE7_9BACL